MANDAIVKFIIHILLPLVVALHRLRVLVCCGEYHAVIKHLPADMGRLVSGVGNKKICFGKSLCYLVIYLIKCHAVMDTTGSDHRFYHKAMAITGRMNLIHKLAFVASFDE